jgi:hypothetical protein
VLQKTAVLLVVLALVATSASAGQPPSPTPQQRGHPYKKAGLIMMGIGGLVAVTALQRVEGLEGIRFQACVAGAASVGAREQCSDERLPNPTLTAAGAALLGGGALIAMQRGPRTPQIQIGRGGLSVVAGFSF